MIAINEVQQMIEKLEASGELSMKEEKYLALAKAFKQLAEENVALKNPDNWLSLSEYGDKAAEVASGNGASEDEALRVGLIAIINRIETPATDSIYAGIKADGVEWIEGNEPSEFGRYWVRYEANSGPRYCSAQWMEYNFCASSDTNIHKIWLADHSRSINSLKGVTHYTKLPAALEGGAL